MNLRPKSFGAKLLLLFILVVTVAQVATAIIISRAHRTQARNLIAEELTRASHTFTRIVEERNRLLVAGATSAARDYQIKQLFVGDDALTLGSALASIRLAIRADLVSALSLEGTALASTAPAAPPRELFAHLIARAEQDPSPFPTATGYGYFEGALYSVAIAPMRAPDIIGWLAIGFRIDAELAATLKAQTGVEVTFLDRRGEALATTLPAGQTVALMTALRSLPASSGTFELQLPDDTALATLRRLTAAGEETASLALQYSLDAKLRPARESEQLLIWVTAGSVVLAVLISRAFAARLVRPITALVGHTRRIAAGDYHVQNTAYREDELGRLSHAFDQMSRGLAERDRVRDLLDKNVSPEVAAQLLRDGAALGGEEREVTVLFADLRGFTTLGERLAPRDLVTLLNRYLDRMSAEIERHGGIIDKFIGDEIMALFGAPVAQSDAPARALAAALAMERALADFNRELAAEAAAGSATARPLAVGIGINTARVVAGNVGSHRRQNYSVLGDGVNVAARLQSLTRHAEFRTNIITSAATVAALAPADAARFAPRSLGPVHVKGRSEPVEVFALTSAT
jgi:adenylate cyclase